MDETPLFFNMSPSKTIAKKGAKSILIRTQNQEKCRISVILTITAKRKKLPPYLIFKGKTNGDIENNWKKILMLLIKDVMLLGMRILGLLKRL